MVRWLPRFAVSFDGMGLDLKSCGAPERGFEPVLIVELRVRDMGQMCGQRDLNPRRWLGKPPF